MLRCNFVTLPSFPVLAILIYSELVSRDKINWAKTAAFSCNCLCRKGLLSISSCESLPSSLKSALTLVAANKGDLKYGSLGTNSVKCNVLECTTLHSVTHSICWHFTLGLLSFPAHLTEPCSPGVHSCQGSHGFLAREVGAEGRKDSDFQLRGSENTLWIKIIQCMAECPQNIFESACYILIQFPIEIRAP